MTYTLLEPTSDYARLQLIGIGLEGYRMIQAVQKQYQPFGLQELSYAVLLNAKHWSIITQETSIEVMVYEDVINRQQRSLEHYLLQIIGDQFQSVDAFFLFTDFADVEEVWIASRLAQLIRQHKIAQAYFSIALINEPARFEGLDRLEYYHQGKQGLLASCDLVIENPVSRLADVSMEDHLAVRLQQTKIQMTLDSLQIFTHLIIGVGLICIDFADVTAVVQNMQEGLVIHQTGDLNHPETVAARLIEQLETEWPDQRTQIEAVLIHTGNVDLKVFRRLVDVFLPYFGEGVRIRAGGSSLPELTPVLNPSLKVTLLAATGHPKPQKQEKIPISAAEQRLEQLILEAKARKA